MHIDTISDIRARCASERHHVGFPNRNSRPAYLLRESVREGKRVRKRTPANLSSLPTSAT
jgi:hypothetical protein